MHHDWGGRAEPEDTVPFHQWSPEESARPCAGPQGTCGRPALCPQPEALPTGLETWGFAPRDLTCCGRHDEHAEHGNDGPPHGDINARGLRRHHDGSQHP